MQIRNIEKLIDVTADWKFSNVAFVKSLQLFADQENFSATNLSICFLCQLRNNVSMWPDTSKEFFEVVIDFKVISALHLNLISSNLIQLSGFNVVDVSDNARECINFQIEDYENDCISFYCKDIEIVSVSKSKLYFFK